MEVLMQEKKQAKIVAHVADLYTLANEGSTLGYAKARGIFRKWKIRPIVGDVVHFTATQDPDIPYQIETILPRKNTFIRPKIANIDWMFLVSSVNKPKPDFLLLEKLAVINAKYGVKTAFIFTKCDLCFAEKNWKEEISSAIKEKMEEKVTTSFQDLQPLYYLQEREFQERPEPKLYIDLQACKIYEEQGYPCFYIFHKQLSPWDKIAFLELIKDQTIALAGLSGVGKSSFLQGLLGDTCQLGVGEISLKIARGKHTTRTVQLYPCQHQEKKAEQVKNYNFYVADTPGFSSLDLGELGIHEEEIVGAYPEIQALEQHCKYRACRHLQEDGCYVCSSAKVNEDRLKRYQLLRKQLQEQERENFTFLKSTKTKEEESTQATAYYKRVGPLSKGRKSGLQRKARRK